MSAPKRINDKNAIRGNSIGSLFRKCLDYPYLMVALAAFLIYIPTLSFDFVQCDDTEIIINSPERIVNLSNTPGEFLRGYMETDYYRPMVYVSFIFDYQIGGSHPFMYHLSNNIYHAIASSLILYLLMMMGFKKRSAIFGALLFAVHPLAVNAVGWIVGRNDLLFAIFGLMSIISLIRFISSSRAIFLGVHTICFLFAIFTKETALLLPLIFILYFSLFGREICTIKRCSVLIIIWMAAGIIWFLMRSLSELGGKVYHSGIDVFIMNLPYIPETIGKFFIPANLSVLPVYSTFSTIAGIIVIAILVVIIFRLKESRNPLIMFGSGIFLILSLPAMYTTLNNSGDWNQYLECRAYLPLAGLMIILLSLIGDRLENMWGKKIASLPIVILITFAGLTLVEQQNYKNPGSFFTRAVSQTPSRAMFNFMLARYYQNTNELEKALKYYIDAEKCNPRYAKYPYNIGFCYFRMKDYPNAITYLDKTITMDSSYKAAYHTLATANYYANKIDESIRIWNLSLSKWPDYSDASLSLIGAYLSKGDPIVASSYLGLLKFDNQKLGTAFDLFMRAAGKYYTVNPELSVGIWKIMLSKFPGEVLPAKNLYNHYNAKGIPDSAAYYSQILAGFGK